MQARDAECVYVAAQHDRVADLARLERREQLFARRGVAVPAVGPVALARTRLLVDVGHLRAVRKDVPLRVARGEPRCEPLFLPGSELRAPGSREIRAIADAIRTAPARLRTGLVTAVLTFIEQ